MNNLTELRGVGVPTASFILTAWNPQEYGTYDFRIRDLMDKDKLDGFIPPEKKDNLSYYLAELKLLRTWRDELKIVIIKYLYIFF